MIDVELPSGPAAGALARGVAACLASVIEVPVSDLPLPGEDLAQALGAWRTWLAEHGSGLVPIADPGRFQWAGWWIAVVEDEAAPVAEVAVLAFGTPPGVVLSPQAPALLGRATADLRIREAHAVASLDPVLRSRATGPDLRGTVEALAVAPAAEAPMRLLDVARARAGRGLDGDRYAAGGRHVHPPRGTAARLRPDPDRRRGPRRAGRRRAGPGLRRHPAQRPHPRHRRQRPGRAALPHRRRAVRRAAAVRALRPPRPAQRPGDPAAAHPPRRAARRRPHRRGDQPGSARPLRLIGPAGVVTAS